MKPDRRVFVGVRRRYDDVDLGVVLRRRGGLLQQLVQCRSGVFLDDQPFRFRPWLLLLLVAGFFSNLSSAVAGSSSMTSRSASGPGFCFSWSGLFAILTMVL